MSVDLLSELASLRQLILISKDDLNRYRAAHSDDSLATVMGPVEPSGIMLKTIAKSAVEDNDVLTALLESCSDASAAKEAIADVMCTSAAAASSRVMDSVTEICELRVNPGSTPYCMRRQTRSIYAWMELDRKPN